MTRSAKRWLLGFFVVPLALSACAQDYTPDGSQPAEETTSDEIEQIAREATLRVRAVGCSPANSGTGSAFVLGERVLVTNRHVVEGSQLLQLSTWDGRDYDVKVVSASYLDDLAVLTVDESLGVRLRIAGSAQPGQRVFAVGYPGGGPWTLTVGEVYDTVSGSRYEQSGDVLRVTAEIRPGNSGGPLLDASGDLLGAVFAIDMSSGLGLVISADQVRGLVEGSAPVTPVSC